MPPIILDTSQVWHATVKRRGILAWVWGAGGGGGGGQRLRGLAQSGGGGGGGAFVQGYIDTLKHPDVRVSIGAGGAGGGVSISGDPGEASWVLSPVGLVAPPGQGGGAVDTGRRPQQAPGGRLPSSPGHLSFPGGSGGSGLQYGLMTGGGGGGSGAAQRFPGQQGEDGQYVGVARGGIALLDSGRGGNGAWLEGDTVHSATAGQRAGGGGGGGLAAQKLTFTIDTFTAHVVCTIVDGFDSFACDHAFVVAWRGLIRTEIPQQLEGLFIEFDPEHLVSAFGNTFYDVRLAIVGDNLTISTSIETGDTLTITGRGIARDAFGQYATWAAWTIICTTP